MGAFQEEGTVEVDSWCLLSGKSEYDMEKGRMVCKRTWRRQSTVNENDLKYLASYTV